MTYIPGVCNITNKGKQRRLLSGFLFTGLTIILYTYLNQEYRIFLVGPIFIASISFMQYIFSFCAFLGIRGKHVDDKGIHYTHKRFAFADKKKSLKILLASIIISIIITILLI